MKDILFVAITLLPLLSHGISVPADACKTIPEILSNHGYLSERYNVTTEDGYKLGLFHILGKPGELLQADRPPLMLQHGISSSGEAFLGIGDNSPALFFHQQGFDVWLPNNRGGKYSRGHIDPEITEARYWDFSFEEIGRYDTKAFVEYIYQKTGKKVLYLGFSRGFMQLMAAFSLEPEYYQSRLQKIMGWAPVVRTDLFTNVLAFVGAFTRIIKLAQFIGMHYFGDFKYDSCIQEVSICQYSSVLCRFKLMFSGNFYTTYDSPDGQLYTNDRTSIKDYAHMSQNILRGGFYRYGDQAPAYNMSNVRGVRIALSVGGGDMLASAANGEWLSRILTNNGNFGGLKRYFYAGHQTFLIPQPAARAHFQDTVDYFRA